MNKKICKLLVKFEIVVTFLRINKTINVQFYGGIATLYDWSEKERERERGRENAARCIHVALLRRINCKAVNAPSA